MALDDRRVLVNGGDPLRLALLRVPLGHPPHRSGLDILQPLHRLAAGHDEALLLLPRRPQRLQLLIMEAVQEPAQRGGLGGPIPQAPFQTGILRQERNVLGAVPANGLEQEDRFDHLGLVKAALALAQPQVGGNQVGQAQGTKDPGGGQGAGVGTGGLLQGAGVQDKGGLGLEGKTRRHAARAIDYLYLIVNQKTTPSDTFFALSGS